MPFYRFMTVFAVLLFAAFGDALLADNVLEERGLTAPELGIRFTYDGQTHHQFPDAWNRLPAEQKVEESVPVEGDRFPRQAITTVIEGANDPKTGLTVTYEKTVYADFPGVVEWVAWFENKSNANTPNLKDVLAADILFQTGEKPSLWHGIGENNDPKLNYSSAVDPLAPNKPLEFAPREGYPSYFAFPYFRLRGEKNAYTIAIGWTGQWSASFCADENGNVRFTAGQQTVDLYLKPGEKIRTPRITVMRYDPADDGINLWRHWFREYILPREEGRVISPKLILDAHEGGELYKDITEKQQIDAIKKFRALGYPCDGLWIDAGWYLRKNSPTTPVGYWFYTGDWTPDPERFPRGMKPLADELAKSGGKLTLWYEPERIYKDAPTFPEYKKYVVPGLEQVESYRMNMASPETVAFLSELIGKSLQENGVKIYRQDSNGVGPLPFIHELEKNDPNFNDRKGMAENLYVQGYLTFWSNLKKMNPGLLFDTCASGGRRNDLDTLRMGAVPLHYSDVGYYEFIEKQRYYDMLCQWFMYFKNIDAHDWDGSKNEYDPYKTTIDLAPFSTVRQYIFAHNTPKNRGYVERFLAVRDYLIDGDYYALEGGYRDDSWTVSQFHDPAKHAGCFRLIRNEKNGGETTTVRPRGLRPEKFYRLENLDTGKIETFKGAELIQNGFPVSMPPCSGEVIRYEEVENGENLARDFADPPAGYGEVPFWWWTGEKLNVERLIGQLEELHKKGISGVQVNYAHEDTDGWPTYRNDPEIFTPEWWEAYSAVSRRCGELGMGIGLSGYTLDWQKSPRNLFKELIYAEKAIQSRDLAVGKKRAVQQGESISESITAGENGDGLETVAAVFYPKEGERLAVERGKVVPFAPGENAETRTVSLTADEPGELWLYTAKRVPGTLHPLHPESGKRVIDKFFQPFVDHSPTGTSEGLNYFFQDELRLGTGPLLWHDDVADEFQKRKGYSLFEALPVFFDARVGSKGVKYRLDYFDVRVALAEERYFQPIFNWHNERGLIYGCDPGSRGLNPFEFFDYFRAIRWYTAPGHDTPGGKADFIKNKVSSSIAHFYHRPRVWLEGYHSLGWGATPELLMRVTCENFIYGANLLNLHGLYYSTYGSHWEWAPPCYHFRMPYWAEMGRFLKYFERLSFLLSRGNQRSEIVILYPVSDFQAHTGGESARNAAFTAAAKLYDAGYNILFIDDESLSRCTVKDGRLTLDGNSYSTLILPHPTSLRQTTLDKALELFRGGGNTVALETLPSGSDRAGTGDAQLDAAVKEMFAGENFIPLSTDPAPTNDAEKTAQENEKWARLLKYIRGRVPLDVYDFEKNRAVKFQHRTFGDREIYVVLGAPRGSRLTFRTLGRPEFYDPWSGKTRPAIESFVTAEGENAGTTTVRMTGEENEAQILVFSNNLWIAPNDAFTRFETDLDEVTELTPPTKSDLRHYASGFSSTPGEKSITLTQNGRTVHLTGTAETPSEPIELGGLWESEILPTMDNRYGDFRLPAVDSTIGPEARRFAHRAVSADEFAPEKLDALLDGAPETTFSYGPKFYRLGPLPASAETDALEKQLAALETIDLTAPILCGGKEYRWSEYAFSWRDGIEGNPGHQGWHGLKEKIDDRFIGLGATKGGLNETLFVPEEGGTVYFLWSTVAARVASDASANAAPVSVAVLGENAPSIHLGAESVEPDKTPLCVSEKATPVLLRFNAAGRAAVVFSRASEPGVLPPGGERTPLSMKWFDDPLRLDYSIRGDKNDKVDLFRWTSPPGLRKAIITSQTAPRVFVGGKEYAVRNITPEQDGFDSDGLLGSRRYAVEFGDGLREASPVVLAIEKSGSNVGGSLFPEPIRLVCGRGNIPLGDWNHFGVLADYSGGIRYTKRVTLKEEEIRGRVTLDLGRLCASASVAVNGESAGELAAPPWRVDVSRLVRPGENQFEIIVHNTLSNHYRTIPTRYRGDSPSGLIGPVRLQAERPVRLSSAP